MKQLVLSFFGGLIGILFAFVGIGVGAVVFSKIQEERIKDDSYLVLRLTDELPEYAPPSGPMSQLTGGDDETLHRILSNLDKAVVDTRISGVVLTIAEGNSAGLAATQEIRRALKRVRASGKKVVGWAESFDAQDYLLLSACEQIFAAPRAYISFTGFWSRTLHVKDALTKLGIEPNVSKIREYKSAAEMVTRSDMSDEARENRQWILEERWRIFVDALKQDRGLDEEKLTGLMNHALFTATEAQEKGLLDGVSYWDELETWLKDGKYGDEDRLRMVSSARYSDVDPDDLDMTGERKIAVVHAQGLIAGRENGTNPLLGLTMGHESVVKELRRARLDEDVAAVVFRVNTRGGDSLASDLIGREVEVTAGVKPVVVSMADQATSGGYAIAYRATKVLANGGTITGSIGSISAKFNLRALFDRLGIAYDGVTKGPMALLSSELRNHTEEERARFVANHEAGFRRWLRDVADHRNMKFEEVEKLAYGRVWTGRQAAANGLIDATGDLQDALSLAKELAQVPAAEKVTVQHLPEQQGFIQGVLSDDDPLAAAGRWVTYRAIRAEVTALRQAIAAQVQTAD